MSLSVPEAPAAAGGASDDDDDDGPEIFNIADLETLDLPDVSLSSAISVSLEEEAEVAAIDDEKPLPLWSGKDGDDTLIDLTHVPELFKAGFVSIVGHPNAGKSTLMNHLVGVPDLCITTSKAQTTRHRIMGVVTGDDFQIVYSDTPGILEPRYELQEEMMQSVRNALSEADVLLAVVDISRDQQSSQSGEGSGGGGGAGEMSIEALTKVLADDKGDDLLAQVLQAATQPVVVALNKVDLVDGTRPAGGNGRRGGGRGGGGGGGGGSGRGAKNRNLRRQEAMAAKRAKRAAREAAEAAERGDVAAVATDTAGAAAGGGGGAAAAAAKQEEEKEAAKAKAKEEEELPFADPDGVLAAATARWRELVPQATIVPVSAVRGKGCDELLQGLRGRLPLHPPLYPADTLTDKPEKFFASEIVREKILKLYGAEIPYSCEVVIKSFKDDQPDGLLRITAVVYVARDSQKGIIIGKQGKDIKRLGTKSRAALEEFFGKQVFLDLKVQVSKDWRFKSDVIKRYGYGE